MWSPSEAQQVAGRLAALAEVLAEPLSPVRIAGYRAALDDLPAAEVFAAIGEAAKACKFFPRPAELREIVAREHDRRALAQARQLAHEAEQRRLAAWQAEDATRHQRHLTTGDNPPDDAAAARFLDELHALVRQNVRPFPAHRRARA